MVGRAQRWLQEGEELSELHILGGGETQIATRGPMRARRLRFGTYLPGNWRSYTHDGSRIVERGFLQCLLLLAGERTAELSTSADGAPKSEVHSGGFSRGIGPDVESVDKRASQEERAGVPALEVVCSG